MVGIDDPGVGRDECFGAQVPLRDPGKLLRIDPGGLAHAGVAEVAGVREQRGVAVLAQPWLARGRAVRVRELVAELRPRVDVDQDVGEVDLRHARGDLPRKRRRRRWPLGAGQPADVKLPVLHVDCDVTIGERAIQRRDALVDVCGELCHALVGAWAARASPMRLSGGPATRPPR